MVSLHARWTYRSSYLSGVVGVGVIGRKGRLGRVFLFHRIESYSRLRVTYRRHVRMDTAKLGARLFFWWGMP